MPEKFELTIKLDPEQERIKRFEELRNKVHKQIEDETEVRIKNSPNPIEEEILAGAFREMIEPQVRDAMFEMYKKGYSTESSGFGGENSDIQQIDGYFKLDDETTNKLVSAGAQVLKGKDIGLPGFGDNYTFIRFYPKEASIDKIKETWDKIVSLLPQKIKSATPSISGTSEEFRKKYAPGRTDIEKTAIEKALQVSEFHPDEEKKMRERLKKIIE